MGNLTRNYRAIRTAQWNRLRNAKQSLASYTRELAEAEDLLATLEEKRIPELTAKIEETRRNLNYHQQKWNREYGGERDAKKERILHLRDHITKLESEIREIEHGEENSRARTKTRRK